jgi:hypothetical protein
MMPSPFLRLLTNKQENKKKAMKMWLLFVLVYNTLLVQCDAFSVVASSLLSPVPACILPCNPFESPDFRYLNHGHAPLPNPLNFPLRTDQYNEVRFSDPLLSNRRAGYPARTIATFLAQSDAVSVAASSPTSKQSLLNELDDPKAFNKATPERSELVRLLTLDNPTPNPGSTESFAPLAVGEWRIVYAPHIYTAGKLIGGSFDPVYYTLKQGGIMTSHARYNFPFIGSGWLSVSGTYGSQDENLICRVDFDKAWVRLSNGDDDIEPYDDLESVPNGFSKTVVQALGNLLFIDSVSKFPVSYLDEDTIVFDFELLGTRICARKVGPAH